MILRRKRLWAGLIVLFQFAPVFSAKAAPEPPAKPMNVLFIAADDLKPVLGCYGDPVAKTPNIDRLAARGTLFRYAYCAQAVCAPSRNCVLTGMRADSIGIYDLETFFRKKVPDAITLPQHFKQNGYHAESMGKIFHVGHTNHDDADSWSVKSWYPGNQFALNENQGLWDRASAAEKGKETKKTAPRRPLLEAADVPDSAYPDGMIAERAIQRLGELKNRPFFLAVGFIKPHLPFCAPKKYWDLYDPARFSLPVLRGLPKDAPAFAGHTFGELRRYTDIPDVGPVSDAQARTLIHGYHAAVSFVDAQVGRILDELDRLGLADNTIVVLWGDHGWHLGDHGLWCKHTNFEQAAHAPLIIRVPGQKNPGAKCDAVVEFVDMYPTLCDLAHLAKPKQLEGASLQPLLENPDAAWDKPAYHLYPRNIPSQGQGMGRAVRTERYRLVEWTVPGKSFVARELYDYKTDPDETTNLANRPENAALVQSLGDLLHNPPKPGAR